MPQMTLHRYFVSESKANIYTRIGTSFLDLPYSIRRRVYSLAGLVRFCPISMNGGWPIVCDIDSDSTQSPMFGPVSDSCYYLMKKVYGEIVEGNEDAIDCACPRLPIALFYVSRLIFKECSAIFYSENKFVICRHLYGGLSPLQNLGSRALALLTSLSIRLNACPCFPCHKHKGGPQKSECSKCHMTCKNGKSSRERSLNNISRNDKAALSEWKLLCNRLRVNIQPLRLRLAFVCDSATYAVAQKIVQPIFALPTLQACSIRLGQQPNHMLRNLAQEAVYNTTGKTQRSVVSYTTSQLPAEILRQILLHTELIAPHALRWQPKHGLITFECCRLCTESLELNSSLQIEAEQIFYRNNHFIAFPEKTDGSHLTTHNTVPTLLSFLTALPSRALSELRSIECFIPNINERYLSLGSDVDGYWIDTVAFVHRHLLLSKLTLVLNLSGQRGNQADYAYLSPQQIADKETAMWTTYQRLVQPFIALAPWPLSNFFVHTSFPLGSGHDSQVERRDEQERELERRVMGEDYDGVAEGKFAVDMLWTRSWMNEYHHSAVFRPDGAHTRLAVVSQLPSAYATD